MKQTQKLRKEHSFNNSGKLFSLGKIELLRNTHYCIENVSLDGDAPKQFIKAYFYEPYSTVRKRKPKSWIPYIAKTAEKWYPHESVIEYLINRIGQEFGLRINEVRLVQANEQIRFLSRYFLHPSETLIHGAEICAQYLNDSDFADLVANNAKSAREFFTFEFIEEAIQDLFGESAPTILKDIVKMLAFDAIVGNNDRHFYNWGVIRNLKKRDIQPYLAPIYDSARGLLWNISDKKLVEHYRNIENGSKFVEKYIKKSYPRISIENDAGLDHFGLIGFLKARNQQYFEIINGLCSLKNEEKVKNLIEEQFARHFIPERTKITIRILTERFSKARES